MTNRTQCKDLYVSKTYCKDTGVSFVRFIAKKPVGKEDRTPPLKRGVRSLSRQGRNCENCDGLMTVQGDELKCVNCSRVKALVIPKREVKERPYLPSFDKLPFIGRDARFARIEMRIRLIPRLGGSFTKTHYEAFCPLCEDHVQMEIGNMQYKKNRRKIFHSCKYKHGVHISTTDKGVFIGWECS